MIVQLISTIIMVFLAFLVIRSWWHSGIAVALTWSIFALEQVLQQSSGFLVRYSSFLNILFAAIAVVAVTKNVFNGRLRGLQIPQALIFLLFLFGLCGLSLVWCPDFEVSKSKLLKQIPYLVIFVLIVPLCVSIPDELNRAIRVVLYLGFLICLGLIFSQVTRGRLIVLAETAGGKVTGNPLAAGSFGGIVALTAIFTIYRAKTSTAIFVLHILIAGTGLFALAKSGSRGQMIAVVVSASIWLPITARVAAKRSSILAIVFSAIIIIGMIYAVTQTGRLQERWSADNIESATMGRLYQTQYLLEIWAQAGIGHWIFGLGSSSAFYYIGFYPHNVPGEILAEEGLIGFFLFLAFLFVLYRDGYRCIRSAQIEKSTRVNLGLLMALITFDLILTFKQGSLLTVVGLFGRGMCIGWVLAGLKKQSRRSPVTFHPNMLAQGQPLVKQAKRT